QDHRFGKAPLELRLSAEASYDPDHDPLEYSWRIGDDRFDEPVLHYTFDKAGIYPVELVVTDGEGNSDLAKTEIKVGNSVPSVEWIIDGNRTFYWDGETVDYRVRVEDEEDGSFGDGIDPSSVRVNIDYIENARDIDRIVLGHQAGQPQTEFSVGKSLIEGSDCRACHLDDGPSVGPSYLDIARKYGKEADILPRLVKSIIEGGVGNWGETAMAAHPQISAGEAEKMVQYILSLAPEESENKSSWPVNGSYTFNLHGAGATDGKYIFSAAYTDRGGGPVGPITNGRVVVLQSPRLSALDYAHISGTEPYRVKAGDYPGVDQDLDMVFGKDGSHVGYSDIDLTHIETVSLEVGLATQYTAGGRVELRLDAPDGPIIGEAEVNMGVLEIGMKTVDMPLEKTVEGVHDLYLVFRTAKPDKWACVLLEIHFRKGQVR
ncbi:MAG: PKD domain-containing protein, partial [Saprospiraceae bacterium]|nr:PKD domain-containing protein [Saprospiraceae bacterium]